mmetsp:Transcript_119412/g.331935  ORF Transcript_119412/g.331935 Transcript_119412/m.331935 type:complete len:157 (-) Transcript_119412:230-700(-)
MSAGIPKRWAWTFLLEGAKFRAGRLYETFWNSQSSLKYTVVFLYPGALFYVRWRAETKYKYSVFIADKQIEPPEPTHKLKSLFTWKNGSPFYFPAMASVKDLKTSVYGSADKVPKGVRAGCYGRMMEDSDNLALAVRTFCKRDPKIVLWEEDVQAS